MENLMPDKVLILDGSNPGGDDLAEPRRQLLAELERRGATVRLVTLRDEALAHCVGCFGCWLETPGLCRSRDRSGPLLEAVLGCGTVVLLTPVTCGGYSSTLKRFVDHWIQTTLPFFVQRHGETHHPMRYGPFPRLVAIGAARHPDHGETTLFQALVARNARNFMAPSWSAGIVSLDDPADGIRRLLEASMVDGAAQVVPARPEDPWRTGAPGRALLLVGSPKPSGSTSGVLGGHLLDALQARGWTADTLGITPSLRGAAGRERLCQAADGADLILLAFPLYIDALPCLATLALEVLAGQPVAGKGLAALVNSGFPEAGQNTIALAMCARLAAAAGMAWAGGLALGGGQAIAGGASLTDRRGPGRPPAGHVLKAMDLAADALAAGRPIPAQAQALMARSPFPGPYWLWRRVFCFVGEQHWKQAARRNGVDLRARPLVVESKKSTHIDFISNGV
jgi:hypothetical protein